MFKLIYPPVCGICDELNKKYLCRRCETRLAPYYINKIEHKKKTFFEYQIKIFRYENIVREKIIEYKFKEKAYMYKTFKKIILNNKKIYSFLKKYDIILAVPLHRKKRWERGYNQTELIAKEIAKDLEIKFYNKVLVKTRNTKVQSTLSKKDRIENVKDAFSVINQKTIKEKSVILFDDIFTTGNTVSECSKVLKQAGAKEIAVLTIAVD